LAAFQRPLRKTAALTNDIAENAMAIAQNTPAGPKPALVART